jgi:hypothetical protein
MTNEQDLMARARQDVRNTLAASTQFSQLPRSDQYETYRNLVQDRYNELARALVPVSQALAEKASDMIDDQRHLNQRIEQAGELVGDFVEQVDFPGFVKDLLKGVFDANIQVMLAQQESFIKLLKAATGDLAKYVQKIDDAESFAYLAENRPDEFDIDFDDSETDESGQPKMVLNDKDGNRLDPVSDNMVKTAIMDAKIRMAQEHRALLRETLLMGITRLVIERGNVKAAVLFDFKTHEKIDKADKAAIKKAKSTSSSISASGGIFGAIFGGPKGGSTRSTQETRISVSSAKSTANTDLAAKLSGSVDITFKTDYFNLNNFAAMYGPGAAGAAPPPGITAGIVQGTQPGGAAPRPPAPAPAPSPLPAAPAPAVPGAMPPR